jgi:CRP/FNR family transcriptional regulator, cyclic AMP receptor protein
MLQHLQPLIDRSVVRTYNAGSTIIFQGEVPRSACILVSGTVRVQSISKQGDDQIVTFHVPGEFFPSSWIFGKTASALFFYDAVTDCEVAFAPRADLIAFMLAKSERMHALLDYFTSNYAASLIRINALEQPKARDKLVYTLYYLCQRFGQHTSKLITIPLNLTHKNFASLVGLTRETTATEMSKLKKEGVIRYQKQHYEIDLEKVMDIIGEDSFRNMSIPIV